VPISGEAIVKRLKREGWTTESQSGSHVKLESKQSKNTGEKNAELDKREADLKAKLASFQKTLAQGKEQLVAERENLKKKENELAAQTEKVERERDKLTGRAEALAEANEKIARRRDKLAKAKATLHDRKQKIEEDEKRNASTSAQYAGLVKERQMLVEVKKFLEVSESEMIRRWATTRAAGLVIGATIAVILMASFSYAVGNKIVEPVWRGDMTVEIVLPVGEETPAAGAWLNSTHQVINNDGVLKETNAQLKQRGVRAFPDNAALSAHLTQHLQVTGEPGEIELAYTHTNKQQCIPVLESLGRAIVGYQLAQDRLNDRKDSVKISSSAALRHSPVADDRVKMSAITFGILIGACLLAWAALRLWLKKTQRALDFENGPDLAILDGPIDEHNLTDE